MAARTPVPPSMADSLILSMVASSDAPLLLLDGDMKMIAASLSFGRAFQIDPGNAPGKLTFELGAGEWNLPKLRSLLSAKDPAKVHVGLGSSIVEALARQLYARIEVAPRNPGTSVSIIHTQIAAVNTTAISPEERAV